MDAFTNPATPLRPMIETAAQDAAEMADLLKEAQEGGATPVAQTAEASEKRSLDKIREEVEDSAAEVQDDEE